MKKMDEYTHPLFFEAKHLTDREKGRIRRYFQKKRDSGGGECGEIETADGDAYKISFMDKEDQERVLQKKFHDITLHSGEVRLTLSRALAPQTPEQPSCSDAQGASAAPPLQMLAKANTKSYEKIFKLDIFLLYYLRDNPKVNKAVEKQLSCINCTMELDFKEEEAVVRGCSEKVPGGADKWEIQVDQVFIDVCESYICYHVMDPKQAKILQQDQSFMTDDIKVYKETGYVVVVGPAETVNERISLLDNSPPTREDLPIGESQFKLVEEEFSREMRARYPDVKFLKGLAMLTLEGPDKEVQLGAAKLAELIKKVAKRRLKICTALMNFITSSNVISKYETRFLQSLRHPVSLEAGSDLVLASVSSDALDEAEAAVLRELVVVDVQLQGAAPPHLKEILNTAKNEENSRELRVDVGFIPGPGGTATSEVRLVGYSENVDKLKNVLLDYQTNQAETQVTVSLPHPELLNSFDAFLNLIGFKRTTVTLKTSLSPSRCVLVSGPRGLVQETQETLNSILASLVSDTLVLDGPGAQRYFRAEGRVSKELVETSGGVLIREQQSVQLPIVATQPQSTSNPSGFSSNPSGFTSNPSGFTSNPSNEVYRHLSVNMNQDGRAIFRSLTSDLDDLTLTMGSEVKLQLVFGSILNETTDAVVNTTDFLNFENGVCKEILTRAGPEVEAELRAANTGRGELFVSSPGSFPCSAIFHVCGSKDVVLIEKLMGTIVDQCETSGCKSVAIPAICAGVGGLDPGDVAGAILRGVMAATSSTSLRCLTDVRVVVNKMNVFLGFKEEATKTFPTAVNNRDFHRSPRRAVSALQSPPGRPQQPPLSESADLSVLCTNSASRQSVFLFLGLSRHDVDVAMTKLKDLYHAQCATKTFSKEELAGLTMDDMKNLKQPMETEGLYVHKSGWGLTVSGLKDGVNKMWHMINNYLQSTLRKEMRVKEEDNLFTRVTWCILGHTGNWESFPKAANHKLENKDVAAGIMDAQNTQWTVDLQRMEAAGPLPSQRATLKRLEHRQDFTFPLYWDNMAANQPFTKVALQPHSAEYRNVEELFKQTAQETVVKIERLQDVHQRRAYEVQKNQISDKNRHQGGASELLLYHGTTEKNCDAIIKNGFNRSYCGQNGTMYGKGTYFAVEAKYSAQACYSKPAADGSQLMFVARVLTGLYTLGTSEMKVPPPRSARQSNDLYDSVVDDVGNPSIYVVFHDNQAYPDYLITFK